MSWAHWSVIHNLNIANGVNHAWILKKEERLFPLDAEMGIAWDFGTRGDWFAIQSETGLLPSLMKMTMILRVVCFNENTQLSKARARGSLEFLVFQYAFVPRVKNCTSSLDHCPGINFGMLYPAQEIAYQVKEGEL